MAVRVVLLLSLALSNLAANGQMTITKFDAYPFVNNTAGDGKIVSPNASKVFKATDKIKLTCESNKPWLKCWIYKKFQTLGCKATHRAGYQVEANCDNGIEWYGSYKECAVAVLNATKKEDQEWFCELEEDRFIVQQNEKIGTAKSPKLKLTIQ